MVSLDDSAAVATGQVLSQSYTSSLICLLHWGNKGRAQEDGEINVLSLHQVHHSALFNPFLLLSFLHLSSPQYAFRVSSSLSMLEMSWTSQSSPALSFSLLPFLLTLFLVPYSALTLSVFLLICLSVHRVNAGRKFKGSPWEEALASYSVCVYVCVFVLIHTCLYGFVKLNASQMNADKTSKPVPRQVLTLNFSQSV